MNLFRFWLNLGWQYPGRDCQLIFHFVNPTCSFVERLCMFATFPKFHVGCRGIWSLSLLIRFWWLCPEPCIPWLFHLWFSWCSIFEWVKSISAGYYLHASIDLCFFIHASYWLIVFIHRHHLPSFCQLILDSAFWSFLNGPLKTFHRCFWNCPRLMCENSLTEVFDQSSLSSFPGLSWILMLVGAWSL